MFKAKVKLDPLETKQLQQKSDKRSRAKTAGLPLKEDLILQMKRLKLQDESNIQTLIKNIQSMRKEPHKLDSTSPVTTLRGDLDKIEIEEDEKLLANDDIYDHLYGSLYEKQLYLEEVPLKN